MAVKAQIRVVFNRFPKLPGVTRKARDAVLDASAQRVADGAKARTPPRVDTGAMMNGYRVQVTRAGDRVVSNRMPYQIYQELGTSTIAPHPMLLPAAEAERPRYEKELARTLATDWADAR